MSVLNLNEAQKLYFGGIEVEKLYKGFRQFFPIPIPDPFLDVVLLHLKGDNFVDSSPNQKSVNPNSNSQINNTFKKYGTGSLDFSALNSYLLVSDHAGLSAWTNVTIEFWVYPTSFNSTNSIYWQPSSSSNNAFTSNCSRFENSLLYFSDIPILVNQLVLNTWNHLAMVVEDTQSTIFHNGILVESITRTLPSFITGDFLIGGGFDLNGVSKANAYFDSFRITNAIRYTQNFNPEIDTFLAY